MTTEIKIGFLVFIIALAGYVYSSFYLGIIEAITTFLALLITLFSAYIFNKGKIYLRVIAVILNIPLIFLFFLPRNIKQGIKDLKEIEDNKIT